MELNLVEDKEGRIFFAYEWFEGDFAYNIYPERDPLLHSIRMPQLKAFTIFRGIEIIETISSRMELLELWSRPKTEFVIEIDGFAFTHNSRFSIMELRWRAVVQKAYKAQIKEEQPR